MKIASILTAMIIMLFAGISRSDDQSLNVRDLHPFGISLNAGGVVIGGASLDIFLTNTINLELCAGLGFGGGLRYYFSGGDPAVKWAPYIGGYFGMLPLIEFLDSDDGDDWRPNTYIPLGIHYISDSGFSMAFEGGYMHAFKTDDVSSLDIPMGAIKIGWRF